MRKTSPRTTTMLLALCSIGLFFGAGLFCEPAHATEGGGGAYANGAEDFMSGAFPPPGNYLLDYLNYYHATDLKDRHGDSLVPDFELTALVNVVRLVHVTNHQILGADWGMNVVVPLVHTELDATMGKDDLTGLGDVVVNPLILGWHSKNLHVTAGVDTVVPMGSYKEDRLVNTGRNYWTFEPVVALTYLCDRGFELSGKFMYDINLENPDTDYRSGQEFHVDYTTGYHVNRDLAVGLGGYYYYQTTYDELDGDKVGTDGFKGRVMAVGPQAAYHYQNMSFVFKWQKEFEARNRPQGNNLWGRLILAF
jgi:hypothetical protein